METVEKAPLHEFVADVERIVETGGSEQTLTAQVADSLRKLVERRTFLEEWQKAPIGEGYAMYPLHVDPDGRFSVAAAVWGVDQQTPIHDHGTWGVIGIYQGSELEIRYDPPDGGAPVRIDEHHLHEGDVTVCCTTDADVHSVACASQVPCIGIHVYGADIGTLPRRTYDADTGEQGEFVSSWTVAPG